MLGGEGLQITHAHNGKFCRKMAFNIIITTTLLMVFREYVEASRQPCQATSTLATFNAALIPSYPGSNGDPEIEERASLLIEQVVLVLNVHDSII